SPYTFLYIDHTSTSIFTPSLHDALPIFGPETLLELARRHDRLHVLPSTDPNELHTWYEFVDFPRFMRIYLIISDLLRTPEDFALDRKSTRLNSSHVKISYAVFCLKKKLR